MLRRLSMFAFVALVGCTAANPAPAEDPSAQESVDSGKDDGLPAASISPRLAPLVAFLRDDKNLVKELGPEGTDAVSVRKRVKVVRYTEFGKAVDVAARTIAAKYTVDGANGTYRRGNGLVDLITVGDMYVTIKTGYGDDSFIDKLIVEPKRAMAKQLSSAVLPEGAMVQADHASTTSTGNYVVVLGDITSSQAIVMSVEYQIN